MRLRSHALADEFRAAVREHRLLIHITALYFLAAAALDRLCGTGAVLRVDPGDPTLLVAVAGSLPLLIALGAVRLLGRARPGRPLLRPAWSALRRRLLGRRQAVRLAVLLLVGHLRWTWP